MQHVGEMAPFSVDAVDVCGNLPHPELCATFHLLNVFVTCAHSKAKDLQHAHT